MTIATLTERRTMTMYRPTAPNVVAAYQRATEDQALAGKAWYGDARRLCESLRPDNVPLAAGVLAVLSANKGWNANARAAIRSLRTGVATGHTGANLAKADRILAGEDPRAIVWSGSGRKVASFFESIVDPGTDHVVIDRHAFRVAAGRMASGDDITLVLKRKGQYERWARAYRRAASALGEPVSTVQAVTWLVWRAEHPDGKEPDLPVDVLLAE